MTASRIVRVVVSTSLCMLLLAPAAWAQTAAIAGAVSDNTGGILPGVTVTAASPALIEQQRVVVTDGQGLYTIINLQPGTYSVTFELPGFGGVVREGVELVTGFTANIDAQLSVGAIAETITVTGATPTVDVQNVRRQQVVTRELLDTLPISTKHINNLITLTPGFTGLADVGGAYGNVPGAYHGKRGTQVAFDGMGVENSSGNSSYQINSAAVDEMVLQTSGIGADTKADGAVVNVIPKEGGNSFSGILSGFYANDSMESDNLSQALQDQGLTPNRTLKLWDQALSLGGPVMRDRLWFLVAARSWGFSRVGTGVVWNQSTAPGAPPTGQPRFLTPPGAERKVVNFVPWTDRPDDRFSGRLEWYDSYLTRVTWQATERNKFNVTYDEQRACNCGSTRANRAQEHSAGYRFDPNRLMQVTWTSAVTGRLLLEAGHSTAISQWNQYWMPGVDPDHIYIQDQGTGLRYGANSVHRGDPNNTDRYSQRFSASYVTGSHNFKAGVLFEELVRDNYYFRNGQVFYRFRNGVPNRITQYAGPTLERNRVLPEMGIFAQDQWTLDRLTLNLGIRFDWQRGSVPAQTQHDGQPNDPSAWRGLGPTLNPWLTPIAFDPVQNVPNFKDISPRIGAAYDLFGDGRTAIKVALGRYTAKSSTGITAVNNPINSAVNNTNRSWSDANGDYVPDCDLGNFAANGECGPIDNENFGKGNPRATRWNPETLSGWFIRDYNWDFSLELQQELLDGFSMNVGYFRNGGGYYTSGSGYGTSFLSNVRVTDNLKIAPEDFDPYCITAPTDSRLPGGGGYEVCGLYDIDPAKFGQSENLITGIDNFGAWGLTNDFINVGWDARLANGIQIGGGFDTGRSISNRCFVVDNPQELLNCRVETPFKAQTQVKVFGSFPLPGEVNVSFTYQNLSGEDFQANLAVSGADIEPSLGRPLAGGRRTATVPLVAPQTLFADRVTRLDFRLSKIITAGRYRFQANFDAYNLTNSSVVRTLNSTYGSRWQRPNSIIDPRLIELGGQISF